MNKARRYHLWLAADVGKKRREEERWLIFFALPAFRQLITNLSQVMSIVTSFIKEGKKRRKADNKKKKVIFRKAVICEVR